MPQLPRKTPEETETVAKREESPETSLGVPATTVSSSEKKQPCLSTRRFVDESWLLAAAFLIGSAAAGIIQAGCDAKEWEILQYYLSNWNAAFSVRDAAGAVTLFRAEYLTLVLFAGSLLLLGFSVLGTQLIFLLMMLYGMGSGLLLVQLCAGAEWQAVFAVILAAGVPAAFAEGCLCRFATSALRMSRRLQRSVFHKAQGVSFRVGALMGQYLLLLAVFAPLCGLCVGLSYLVSGL